MSKVYGIWNSITRRFVYGIKEPSKIAAEKKLFEKAGKGGYAWRYEAKEIPNGYINPPNELYPRK